MGFLQNLFTSKEKIEFNSFVRMMVNILFKNNPVNLAVVDQDNTLTIEDKEKIQDEILYFRIILLMFFLVNKQVFGKKSYTSEDIGKAVGICYGLECRDAGMDQESMEKQMDVFNTKLDYYFNYLQSIGEKEVEEKGVFFYLCKCFADYILDTTTESFADPAFVSKNFTVFDIAKQTYQNSEEAFNGMIKNIEFTD
jgi:hypothetical protein